LMPTAAPDPTNRASTKPWCCPRAAHSSWCQLL
jgi:hypothetical protein